MASCAGRSWCTDAAGLAERQSRLGHSGAGLRLYPLSHPAAAGLPRPHRQEPAGGGARSRRQPLQRLPACHPAAVEDGHPGRQRHHRAADVRRLLHAEHRLRLAQDQHAGQPDRHLFPRRAAALRRRGADLDPVGLPGRTDGLLHVYGLQGPAGGPAHERDRAEVAPRGARRRRLRRLRDWIGNPWGRPRFLVLVTWLYIADLDRAGHHRDPVLLQRRPVGHGLAGLLPLPLVLERPGQFGLA